MLLSQITDQRNPSAEWRKITKTQRLRDWSAGRYEVEAGMAVRVGMGSAVRAAGAAGLGAGAQRLVDNGLDGARATAAFGATTEATIDLLGIAGKVFRAIDRTADIVVGQHVAGTNNHETAGLFGDAVLLKY
jgi:hypothetical protein